MKRLCLICARGGSVGIKNKNIRTLCGKPLIAHTILQAQKSGLFDIITVSSDSAEILAIAKQYRVDYLIKRPAVLATAIAAKLPVLQHALLESERLCGYGFDVITDLDVTSPLRNIQDIKKAVGLLEAKKCDNVITGAPARRSPYFNLIEMEKSGKVHLAKTLDVPVVRRQDSPKCYDMNASIYVWWRDTLLTAEQIITNNTLLYVMPEERSVDIDSELDFMLVELLMLKGVDI